jgi:hypothetical protein
MLEQLVQREQLALAQQAQLELESQAQLVQQEILERQVQQE